MSDNNEKNEALRGGQRNVASRRETPDRVPARNTAPAGTPAQKYPSSSPRRPQSEPEQPAREPAAREPSERPPASDTISAPRTVGGQTARLKAKQLAPEEESSPGIPAAKPAGSAKGRLAAHAHDGEVASKALPRGGEKNAAKAAQGAKDGGASWEADVKISEPDLAGQKGQGGTPTGGAGTQGGAVESRWHVAIPIGAITFAIGILLPLPFRKQIVDNPDEAGGVAATQPTPSGAARIPLLPRSSGAAATPQPPAAATGSPTTGAPPPSTVHAEKPAGATAPPPLNTALPNTASSGGKNPTRNGKPGRIGDIF